MIFGDESLLADLMAGDSSYISGRRMDRAIQLAVEPSFLCLSGIGVLSLLVPRQATWWEF